MKNNFLLFLCKYCLPRQNTEYQLFPKKEVNFKAWIIIFFFFSFLYFLVFKFTILYWFYYISKWICHRYTCVLQEEFVIIIDTTTRTYFLCLLKKTKKQKLLNKLLTGIATNISEHVVFIYFQKTLKHSLQQAVLIYHTVHL